MPVSHLPGEAPVVRHVVVVSAEELPWPGTCTGVYPLYLARTTQHHLQTCYTGHQGTGMQCFNATVTMQCCFNESCALLRTEYKENPVTAWWVGGRPDATHWVDYLLSFAQVLRVNNIFSVCYQRVCAINLSISASATN